MFQVDHICGATVLVPDVVRMNPEREQIIRDFVSGPQGRNCNAIIGTSVSGDLVSIDLFAGDDIQREAFKQALTKEIFA